jgi:hypothetical protein
MVPPLAGSIRLLGTVVVSYYSCLIEGCPMLDFALENRNGELAYQIQLDNLCDEAMRQRDRKYLRKLMDQNTATLAENQKVREKSPVHILVVPIQRREYVE